MGHQGSNKPSVERYLKGMKREEEKRELRAEKKKHLLSAVSKQLDEHHPSGLILTRARSGLLVQDERNNEHHWCRARQKGRILNPVPGDRVVYEPSTPTSDGRILDLYERTSFLRRWSFGRIKEIAANLEQMVILATIDEPPVSPRLVDRLLVGASCGGFEALIVVNKIDLAGREKAKEWGEWWRRAGYDVLLVSAETEEGIGELYSRLRNRSSLLTGASGVGKSTVLNRLIEDLNLDTSAISEATGRGVHTTAFTRLFLVPGGGIVADSPGIREFFPVLDAPEELRNHFPEFREPAEKCTFADCLHFEKSDGCEVRRQVESGRIHPDRYTSYLTLYDSLLIGPQRGRGPQLANTPV
ncbi:MAG: ribosome small subunit-dependent GTPase A [bacterium]